MIRPIRWSDSQCLGWLIDQLVFMEIVTIVVEVILVMRREPGPFIVGSNSGLLQLTVYILYNRNKLILSAIVILFVAEIVIMVAALTLALPKIKFEGHCYVLSTPSFYVAYW